MALLERELARRSGEEVITRSTPMRLRFRFAGLACSDPHLLRVTFSCSIQALQNPIELRALAETFLSARPAVTVDEVVEHFTPALRASLAALTRERTAEQWTSGVAHDALIQCLRKAASALEFDAGVKLLPPFDLVAESETLARQRVEETERRLAEERAAGQLQHVQRTGELLKQFRQMREAAPELSAGQILERLSAADRGQMYETLLLATPAATRDLWAVAGDELLSVDLSVNPPKAKRVLTVRGPFRSVNPGKLGDKAVLLMGARSHVAVVERETLMHRELKVDAPEPQLGFNRVIVHNDEVWATHGELGLRAWDGSGKLCRGWSIADLPKPTFQRASSRVSGSIQTVASVAQRSQPAGPRNIHALDELRLIFSIGNLLVLLDSDCGAITPLEEHVQADVLAVLPDGQRILVIHDNGTIHVRDARTLELLGELARGSRVCSAALLPWLGESRLLLAQEDGCIDCIGLQDSITSEYRSGYHDIRDLSANGTSIAAITADRTRIVLWQAWEGRKPYAEVHITVLARRRVGDICFG